MTSTLRPSSINIHENHWQHFVSYYQWKRINIFDVCSTQFCHYLVVLFDDNTAPSTVISHRTSISLVLRYWRYDPNVKLLLRGIWLEQLVQHRAMPQWNLHLVLSALLLSQFSSAGDVPTGRSWPKMADFENLFSAIIDYSMQKIILTCCKCDCSSHNVWTWCGGRSQSTGSLLPEPGFRTKNQLHNQVPLWMKVPWVDHFNPNESEMMLCPVRQLFLFVSSFTVIRWFGTCIRATFHYGLLRWWRQQHISRATRSLAITSLCRSCKLLLLCGHITLT